MNRSITIKIAVLIPVVLSTSFVTSQLLGQSAKKRKTLIVPKITVQFGDGSKVVSTASRQVRPQKPLASYFATSQDIKSQGKEVLITATVEMQASFKGTSHLWRVRAFRESDKTVVFDKPYADQIFEMHPSGQMSPTFSDSFALESGTYRVVLSLYGVPKGYDVSELNDEDKATAAILVQIPKVVEIP